MESLFLALIINCLIGEKRNLHRYFAFNMRMRVVIRQSKIVKCEVEDVFWHLDLKPF